jgi:transcriptional regulator with XRE-family HTH domain
MPDLSTASTLGDLLARLRGSAGLSQQEAAQAIAIRTGRLSPSALGRIERGEVEPRAGVLAAMQEVYRCTAEDRELIQRVCLGPAGDAS